MASLSSVIAAFDALHNMAWEEDDYHSMVPTYAINDLAVEIEQLRGNPKDYVLEQLADDTYVFFGEYETFEEAERIARTLEYGTFRIHVKSLGIYTKGVLWDV